MRLGLFLLVTIVFLPLLFKSLSTLPQQRFDLDAAAKMTDRSGATSDISYQEQFASSGGTRAVHSAVMVNLKNGNVRAFWYGGEREGAKDVSIYTAELDISDNQWRDEYALIERLATAQQLGTYLRKVGNPAAFRDSENRLWLFFVSVSVGGWAGSSLNYILSEDDGQSWSAPTRLVTSPIFNLSTLVKGEPYLYADGSIGVPIYHEMIGKFGELLHLSPSGEVLDKVRLMAGRISLQPIVLPRDADSARAYMRNASDLPDSTLLETWTDDGGKSWSPVVASNVPNPNAAVTGLRLDDGGMLMVINNQYDKRNNLSLMYSRDDGESWQLVYAFEQEENTPEMEYQFSYPSFRQAQDGDFHILYTWNKLRIKHIRFNQQWLNQRLRALP